jgi:hypothetical protein
MFTYNSALDAQLDAATTKKQWCDIIIAALGATRTITCKRDAAANAADVFATGTTFFSAQVTGAMNVVAGNLVTLGSTSAATTKLAADLATGKSVLRIEGNGNWIQGDFGLLSSSADFRVKRSPTSKSGLAFRDISISAPRHLPSGTGAPPPVLDTSNPAAKVPVKLELYSWINPASPTLAGSINLNVAGDNIVFEDTEVATELGDVRVTQGDSTILYDGFECGVIMMSIRAELNSEANVPLNQVLVSFKPHGTWPTYPFADTLRPSRDRTVPRAYKAVLKAADNSVIHIFQMRDGLPINDPSLSQRHAPGFGALRPWTNCANILVWQSHLPKPSTNLAKYFGGVQPESYRPSIAKEGTATNALIPQYDNSQVNAVLHYYAMPEWPIPFDSNIGSGGTPALNDLNTFDDPFLYDVKNYHGGEGNAANTAGWRYEPGSISGHDWYTGPGGPRSDRAPTPTPLIMFASDPESRRVKGNVLYRTLCDEWGKAYFNASCHYMQNVKTFEALPKSLVIPGKISQGYSGYYGSRDDYVAGGATRHLDTRAKTYGGPYPPLSRDGKWFFNLWQLDDMHSYACPGQWVLAFNSPMHLIAAYHRFVAHTCVQLGRISPTHDPRGSFLARESAWRWLHYTTMWKIATKHKFGIDRATLEEVMVIELEKMYDMVVKPCKIDNNQSLYFQGLRRFGMPAEERVYNDNGVIRKAIVPHTDTKAYYFTHVLVMMRQFGLFKVLRAKSSKCADTLAFIIESLDKFTIDMFHITEGRANNFMKYSVQVGQNDPAPTMATSWADWNTNIYPKVGQEDFVRKSDGTVSTNISDAQNATMSLRGQWVFARRDYFPEYAHPNLASVCTQVQGYYDAVTALVASKATPREKSGVDWGSMWPPLGFLKPPVTLEGI